MLGNICDRRKNRYAAKRINVVIEPSWHDNSIDGSDQYARDDDVPSVDERYGLSLAKAIEWANSFPAPMTLYLYDIHVDPMAEVRASE